MIDGLGRIWNHYIKRKPAVPKPSAVDSEGVMSGEEHETREHSDYSDKKKAEAETHFLYGSDGQKKPIEDGDHHDKLDEIG